VLPSRRVGGMKRGSPVTSGWIEGRQGIVPSARVVAAGGAAVPGGWDGPEPAGPQAAPDSSSATARVSRRSLVPATSDSFHRPTTLTTQRRSRFTSPDAPVLREVARTQSERRSDQRTSSYGHSSAAAFRRYEGRPRWPQQRGKAQVASRAVRKMSVFQRRGRATSPLWWGSSVAGRGARAAGAMSAPNSSNRTNWCPATAPASRPSVDLLKGTEVAGYSDLPDLRKRPLASPASGFALVSSQLVETRELWAALRIAPGRLA
jgi:hypothetical protein